MLTRSVRAGCMLLRRAIPDPNGGDGELVSFACDVGSQLARRHMLAQVLPTVHIGSVCRAQHLLRRAIPEWEGDGICQLCTRSWRLVCQKAHARTLCACRTMLLRRAIPDPNGGMGSLSVLHAKLAVGLSGGKCSPVLCGERIRMAEMVESVIPARAAGNQLVSQRMLA